MRQTFIEMLQQREDHGLGRLAAGQEMLDFDEAAVDHDERPLITMRFRAASLRELLAGRS